MRTRIWFSLLVGVLAALTVPLLSAPSQAASTSTLYTSRTAWEAVTTGVTTETFDGIAPGLYSDYGAAMSLTLSGMTFSVDPIRRMFIVTAGLYAPTQVISAQQSGQSAETLKIQLPGAGATSLSFDAFLCSIESIDLSTGEHLSPSSTGFIGVTSSTPITSLDVSVGGCGNLALDNFSYGTLTPAVTGLAPTIAGLAQVGQTLTADPGPVEPADATLSYVWKADGAVLPGAVGPTLALTPDLVGKHLKVKVTASHDGYQSETATSSATPYVRALVEDPLLQLDRTSVCPGQDDALLVQGLSPGNRYQVVAFGETFTRIADKYGELHFVIHVPSGSDAGPHVERSIAVHGTHPRVMLDAIVNIDACGV